MAQPRSVQPCRRRTLADATDDADLEGVMAGDERSFERLVERHHGTLRRLAAWHGVTGPEADRALVRTWSAFLDAAGSEEPTCSVRSLLAGLLVEELSDTSDVVAPARALRAGRPGRAPAPGRRNVSGQL